MLLSAEKEDTTPQTIERVNAIVSENHERDEKKECYLNNSDQNEGWFCSKSTKLCLLVGISTLINCVKLIVVGDFMSQSIIFLRK